jgi:hypothetical protein
MCFGIRPAASVQGLHRRGMGLLYSVGDWHGGISGRTSSLCQAGRGRGAAQPQRITSVLHLFGAGGWRAPGVVGAFICLVARRPAQLQALPGVRGVCMECIMATRLRHTACTLMGLSGCMMLVVGEYGRVCWGSGDESLQTC